MLIRILCNKLLLGRAELARSFHEPQKQARLELVLSVEPVRAELSCYELELFFPALDMSMENAR